MSDLITMIYAFAIVAAIIFIVNAVIDIIKNKNKGR